MKPQSLRSIHPQNIVAVPNIKSCSCFLIGRARSLPVERRLVDVGAHLELDQQKCSHGGNKKGSPVSHFLTLSHTTTICLGSMESIFQELSRASYVLFCDTNVQTNGSRGPVFYKMWKTQAHKRGFSNLAFSEYTFERRRWLRRCPIYIYLYI